MRWRGVIEEHRDRLPVSSETPVVTLLEGGTPLIPAPTVSDLVERDVFLKFEGMNPTGSFKDRGMTLAVSKAVEDGAGAIVCASTGNTSASAAAYAARAGIDCVVVLPAGKIAAGKLAQAIAHGATIVPIDGNFDDALAIVRLLSERYDVVLVNSLNPYRIEAQKTAAFEVVDDLGHAPAVHALPVGNAGNITAYWRGYREIEAEPQMWGFQATGAAPIVFDEIFDQPETVATAIRVGNPASWEGATEARDASRGRIEAVTDGEILDTYRLLSRKVGVFCEPASAAGVAGVIKFASQLPDGDIVCTVTGHGLKDPETASVDVKLPSIQAADVDSVARSVGW
ncbi:MAG: threonine synthase [Acidimicrobiia bacterium]|nr:MAG: threonine synthase [Acidimicrobiia bacterium]